MVICYNSFIYERISIVFSCSRRADAERLFPAWADRVERGKLLCFHLAGEGTDKLAR